MTRAYGLNYTTISSHYIEGRIVKKDLLFQKPILDKTMRGTSQ